MSNAYFHVFTNSIFRTLRDDGFVYGFLVVEEGENLHIWMGDPIMRGRAAAVQTMSLDQFKYFVNNYRCIPVSEREDAKFSSKDNCWVNLVNLDPEIYANLLDKPFAKVSLANNIINYLRHTISGYDNDKTIYPVNKDFRDAELDQLTV